jgi:hypothetical protein
MRCRQCQKLLNAIARVGVVLCVACLVGSAHGHDPLPVHDRCTCGTLPNYATTASSSTRSTQSSRAEPAERNSSAQDRLALEQRVAAQVAAVEVQESASSFKASAGDFRSPVRL